MASKTEMEGGAVGGKNADDDASVMASKTELEGGAVGGMNVDDDAASMVSHASGSSSGNVKTKLKVMQILEEHKKAELRTKLAALSAKRELQRQRQELQWKEEQLALDTEMAVHQARSDVVEKFEKELDGEPAVFPAVTPRPPVFDVPPPTVSQPPALASSVSLQVGPIPAGPVLMTGVPHHAVHPPDQSSQPPAADQRDQLAADQHDQPPAADQGQQAGITDVLTGLTQLLTEQTRRYLLPALEPRVFKGDIEEFSLWMKSFECYIEARTTSPAERLHFLTQYTGGEARSAIHGLLHLQTEDAYTRAKKLLTDRYGNDFITANTYKRRLREWPAVRNGDGKALRQLADFLEHLLMASEEVVGLRVLDEPSEIGQILKKLPRYVLDRWKRVVDTSIYDPAPGQVGVYPSFSQFTRFLTKEARVACGPVTLQEEPAHVEQRTPARRQVGPDRACAFLAATTDSRKPKCAICDAEHQVDECGTFNRMGLAEKTDAVMRHGLCKGCLKTGHIWRSCRKKMKCEKCFRWHPTALHDDSLLAPRRNTAVPTQASHQQETRVKAVTLQVTASDKDVPCSHSMVVPVRLECEGHPEHEVVVYALLDPQSDACFIKESVGNQIQAKGEEVLLELSTMAGKATMKTASMKNLIVKSIDGDADIKLPTAYSRQEIPADRHLIPRAETVRKWPHLEAVSEQLPRYFPDAEVGLLIGMNCPRALKPRDVVLGDDEEPWAVKTELGWSVVGPMRGASTGARACRYTSASEGRGELCHFAFRVHAREVTPMQIARMLEADFQEVRTDKRMSQEDQRFLKLMEEKMQRREDRHYEEPLPLNDPTPKLPNNRQAAKRRLTGVNKTLNRDPSFQHDSEACMNDMLKKGYVKPVSENELLLDDGSWWADRDLTEEPTEHRKATDLIGVTSSTSTNAAAEKSEDICEDEAADFICKDCVDDGPAPNSDADTATRLVTDTASMNKEDRFGLHSIVSNDPEEMKAILSQDQTKNLQNVKIVDEAISSHQLVMKKKLKVIPKYHVTVTRLEPTAAVRSVTTSRFPKNDPDNSSACLTVSPDLPSEKVDLQVDEEGPDVNKLGVSSATRANCKVQSHPGSPEKFVRFPSWFRAKKADCLRYRQRLYRKTKERAALLTIHQSKSFGASPTEVPITTSELRQTDLKFVLTDAFKKELKLLRSTEARRSPGSRAACAA